MLWHVSIHKASTHILGVFATKGYNFFKEKSWNGGFREAKLEGVDLN